MNVDMEASGSGLDDLLKRLDRLEEACSDLSAVWPKVGQVFAQAQREVFAGANTWPPLKTSTVLKKKSTRILVDKGLLEAGATNPTPIQSNELSATFGVPPGHPSRQYAFWHYLGRGVPERDPVPNLSPAKREAMFRAAIEPIREVLR
jgi:hypothetical protein